MSNLDVSYPGVYVQEDTSLSLSVGSSATAVPVIFFTQNDCTTITGLTAIDSWLSFITLVKNPVVVNNLHRSLRAYFDNGGGRCYIAPVDAGSTNSSELAGKIVGKADVTLLVQAGLEPTLFNNVIKEQELAKIFAIYDGISSGTTVPTFQALTEGHVRTEQAAVYFPWLKSSQYDGLVAPSAAVAGVYCKTDSQRGVWKAPANVAIVGGLTPALNITDKQQGDLNAAAGAVNVIRQFRNGDTLVWGARTLSKEDNWRYVPVRRLFNAIEVDIKTAMQPAMFEPNVPMTWEKIRSAIDIYLHSLWQQGGLFGSKPEEAYFVKIGLNSTMSEEDISQGIMVVKVGVAAVRPAEFIILEFSQFVANS